MSVFSPLAPFSQVDVTNSVSKMTAPAILSVCCGVLAS